MAEDGASIPRDVVAADSSERGSVGSRAHVRQTLERAHATLAAARGRLGDSDATLERAGDRTAASERAVQESLALRTQLHASVTAYVRGLKADAIPPERMLALVKSTVLEATPPELDVAQGRALMEDAVRWSIDAYYGAA